jgi:CheY-like chemotaxis protein
MAFWFIVEDEPDLYDTLRAMSDLLGQGGVAFVTGEEACEWIDEYDENPGIGPKPELALLDIRLPEEISGIDVGAHIRQSKELNDIAIILITAYRMNKKEEQQAIKDSGADLLVYKPLPLLSDFARMLEEVVAARTTKEASTASVNSASKPGPVRRRPRNRKV